jgi:hypothetical protein
LGWFHNAGGLYLLEEGTMNLLAKLGLLLVLIASDREATRRGAGRK